MTALTVNTLTTTFLVLLVSTTEKTNGQTFEAQDGETRRINVTEYKWASLVEDIIPKISDKCEKKFHECYKNPYTFTELFYEQITFREYLCVAMFPHHNLDVCLMYEWNFEGNGTIDSVCEFEETYALWKFICLNLDFDELFGDDKIPPITEQCAMSYWKCSNVKANILERLNEDQKQDVCQNMTGYYYACLTKDKWDRNVCRDEEEIPKIEDYVCASENSTNNTAPVLTTPCQNRFVDCFSDENSGIFKLLRSLKNETDQFYACGRLYSCLVQDSICTEMEAKTADEFMCSDVTFTPDIYNLFMLSDQCRVEGFENCFDIKVPGLRNDYRKRRELCETRMHKILSCEGDNCDHRTEGNIIGDFLCFNEDDQILQIGETCLEMFMDCFNHWDKGLGFSELEVSEKAFQKLEMCKSREEKIACMTTDNPDNSCSISEWDIVRQFICTFGNNPGLTLSEKCVNEFETCYAGWEYLGSNSNLDLQEMVSRREFLCDKRKKGNRHIHCDVLPMSNITPCSADEFKVLDNIFCGFDSSFCRCVADAKVVGVLFLLLFVVFVFG